MIDNFLVKIDRENKKVIMDYQKDYRRNVFEKQTTFIGWLFTRLIEKLNFSHVKFNLNNFLLNKIAAPWKLVPMEFLGTWAPSTTTTFSILDIENWNWRNRSDAYTKV
jgi:hypothetical protein